MSTHLLYSLSQFLIATLLSLFNFRLVFFGQAMGRGAKRSRTNVSDERIAKPWNSAVLRNKVKQHGPSRFSFLFTFIFCLITCAFSTTVFSQTGIIKGAVTDAVTNEPVMFATVYVAEAESGATTDLDGNYIIENLEPGIYSLTVSYIGYKEQSFFEIQVSNSRPAIVDVKLEEASTDLEEIVVVASPFRKTAESPVSLRSIGITEIKRSPGASRDISKVVQNLPGVTSTATFRNDLIIRGGAPNENRFYLDDVEVPNINHFATQGASGGPVGLINVDFIREVDFYSGAYPANRGNSLSSVFNFKQKNGRDDRIGFTATVGASDLGITLEGPIGSKTTFLASARRSYLQFLFKALELPFLPIYNDFQTKITHKFNKNNELYFIGLGAIDNFELNLDANNTEEQQYLLGQLPVNEQWNYTNGLVYKHYDKTGFTTFVLSRNMLNNEAFKYQDNDESDEANLILRYKSQEIENKLRVETTRQLGDYRLVAGVGYEFAKYNNSTFNRIFTPAGPQNINYASEFTMNKYGAFAQVSRTFIQDKLTVSAGVRMDGNSYSDDMSNPFKQLSPRASIAYAVTDRFSINANTGLYYQLPPYTVLGYQEGGVFINKQNDITYIRNAQGVLGFEYNLPTDSKITIEGYYKKYDNYPFLLRDSLTLANLGGDFGVIGNEAAESRSAGRAYGLEILFQQRLFKGFYGIASYTLGRSEFEDKNGDFVASSWDARHIANITIGKRFKRNWELGIAWRVQTGLPFTPFDESRSALVQSWDVTGRGIPNYNLLNTERGKISNAIDFRVDKKWFFKKWSFNLFLDVENITANAVGNNVLILDRPLDADGTPQGDGVILNPSDPISQQQYQLKSISDAQGTVLPTLGIVIEY